MNIKLPSDVELLLDSLVEAGYEAYIVGGCVRDYLLNKEPHDYDICTSAKPNEVKEVFSNYNVIETGIEHGTVTLMLNKVGYEITTYRTDGKYLDNRRPESVSFTPSLKEDLNRRDFTMNAIAYSNKNGFIDPHNGIQDIENKIIRCVGDPSTRFREDSLRILRAWRFFCSLKHFTIEPNTKLAMARNIELLNNVSAERIREELLKAINGNNFPISVIEDSTCLEFIIPEWSAMKMDQHNDFHCYTVDCHTIHSLMSYKGDDMIVRLAILFHDLGKPKCFTKDENGVGHFYGHAEIGATIANRTMHRLKFDNETRDAVVELIEYHDATFICGEKYIKRWLNKIGEIQFRRLLDLRKADVCGQSPKNREERLEYLNKIEFLLNRIIASKQCFTLRDLNINGSDLMEVGYTQGKRMGDVLHELLSKVIDNKIENDRKTLLDEAYRYVNLNT